MRSCAKCHGLCSHYRNTKRLALPVPHTLPHAYRTKSRIRIQDQEPRPKRKRTQTTHYTPPHTTPVPSVRRNPAEEATKLHARTTQAPPRALPFSTEHCRRLLEGVKSAKCAAILTSIESMAGYVKCMQLYKYEDDTLVDSTILPLYEAANINKIEQHQFVQLCEESSRRIANSKEPRSYRQIEKLDGTVDGALVREAMLDEVKWMVNHGKVIPRDKSVMSCIKEIDGQWVVKFKKTLDGLLERVRARWVLRGDKQRPYLDYNPHSIAILTRSY